MRRITFYYNDDNSEAIDLFMSMLKSSGMLLNMKQISGVMEVKIVSPKNI